MAPYPLLVLDDQQIAQMLRNPQIVSAFPFLQSMSQKLQPAAKKRCGGCSGKQNARHVLDFNGIKAGINGMSLDKKAELKRLLNASKLRFYFINYRKQKVKVTF